MEDLISKKALLLEAGISYGQLYRWKRKGLIPEAWFVRRSTFTGQETFFPREAILERIRWIQGMKTDAALDELAEKIRDPAQWEKRLPADIVWAAAEKSIPVDLSEGVEVSRVEFFARWAADHEGLGQNRETLAAFLQTIPADWLEYPDSVLYGFPVSGGWRFMIARSSEAVWFGENSAPALQIALADVWKQAKSCWEEAERRVQTQGARP